MRIPHRASALGLLAAATLAAAPATAVAYSPLTGDAAEQALLKSVRAEKLIRAREQAEKILKRRPESLIARYALALVFHDEEGNLPRALYHARRAERQLQGRYGTPPQGQLAKEWHRKLLLEQESILGELDKRNAQLALLDRHDKLYKPALDYRRIWALMKLHRFAEATRIAKKVSLSKRVSRRVSGLNGLIAIEMERLRPRATFKVGMKGVVDTGYRSCILLHNTSEAAFAVFKFSEAERLANKALQASMKDCPNSSYPHLASLYLLRGDYQRAMQAVRSARKQGVRRRYRQQFEMLNDSWLFRLLYVLGRFDKVLERGRRIFRAPDRVGMTSLTKEMTRFAAAVEYHMALRAEMERLRERASVRPLHRRLGTWLQLRRLDHKAWVVRRRAARLLANPRVELRSLVRPYFTPVLPWSSGHLIEVAGAGVVKQALTDARSRERMRRTAAYFDALEGELIYRDGDLPRALTLADKALKLLPSDEKLLRGRVEAWSADAAWRLGRRKDAERRYHQVLQRFPTALRILGVRLPVRVLADGRPLSRAIAKTLLGSRRLRVDDGAGFVVRVTGRKDRARLCLESRAGRRYACAEQKLPLKLPKAEDSEAERVARIIDLFHRKGFAPKVDLTQRDINSLDGSAVRGDADELIKKVLEK
jgi:hypothetical protein